MIENEKRKSGYFTKEEEKIGKALRFTSELKSDTVPLSKYKELLNDYQKFMSKANKLVSVSDSSQRKLHNYRQEIEAQNAVILAKSDELQELINTKDKFFSIIAHDLKNPLTALITSTDFLTKFYDKLDDDEIVSGLNGLKSTSLHLKNLLNNLLNWASVQTGKIQFDPAAFEIKELVDENIKLHENTALRKKINLRSLINTKIYLTADRNMISTVLRNLISNALKYTSQNGIIEIGALNGEKQTEIFVRDTGKGIKKADLPKLFSIEVSHSTPGTAKEKGTGLGLLICKEFIEKHEGSITVESKWGKGSTFRITIPNLT